MTSTYVEEGERWVRLWLSEFHASVHALPGVASLEIVDYAPATRSIKLAKQVNAAVRPGEAGPIVEMLVFALGEYELEDPEGFKAMHQWAAELVESEHPLGGSRE